MNRHKVSYSLTRRASQSRIAAAYMEAIRADYDLVATQDVADVVVVHHPPRNYETVYAIHPALRDRYVVSCCVPHAEDIPDLWKRNLSRVQEVWTPSEFCRRTLANYHENVVVMPYVIDRDMTVTDEARIGMRRMVAFDPDLVYFLAIAPLDEPRKNISSLVETFTRISSEIPNARLIIKATPTNTPSWAPHRQVIFLPMQMPAEYVNALYEICTAYVSPHRAEGWGLTISDAMLFGKPVIATAYSGNLEYMTSANAFTLGYQDGEVADQPAPGIAVEPGMRWSTPDQEHLAELLVTMYHQHDTDLVAKKVGQASTDIQRYSQASVGQIIRNRIAEIVQ
ncbi:glycosyltransferase involved in cell wall biosynthesis [Luteibacter sp. HA06]